MHYMDATSQDLIWLGPQQAATCPLEVVDSSVSYSIEAVNLYRFALINPNYPGCCAKMHTLFEIIVLG